ncbi:hypothetical protein SeMB42_g01773 [Synchytrium endobioticum]|uniref:RNA helicase n=1 Tax=Synchytrium endobioticum TaxID=286115 RepID=A0A507DJS7_9FUNG|nr:hypothetical protein SeMB42_g01773 [Synchytrium endobioticum]
MSSPRPGPITTPLLLSRMISLSRLWLRILGREHPRGLLPAIPSVTEVLAGFLGAFIAVGSLSAFTLIPSFAPDVYPAVLSPVGASCVLLYSAPDSPLTQPRQLIGGHVIGWNNYKWIAAGLAVAFTILIMQLTKTVHPPGGATALSAVFGGESIWRLKYQFVLVPALFSTLILLFVTLIINNLFRSQSYPSYWIRPPPTVIALSPRKRASVLSSASKIGAGVTTTVINPNDDIKVLDEVPDVVVANSEADAGVAAVFAMAALNKGHERGKEGELSNFPNVPLEHDEPAEGPPTLANDKISSVLKTKRKRPLSVIPTTAKSVNYQHAKSKKSKVSTAHDDTDDESGDKSAMNPTFQFDADGGDISNISASWNFNLVLDWAKGATRPGFTSVDEKIANLKAQGLGPRLTMMNAAANGGSDGTTNGKHDNDEDEQKQIKGDGDVSGDDAYMEGVDIRSDDRDHEDASSVSGNEDSDADENDPESLAGDDLDGDGDGDSLEKAKYTSIEDLKATIDSDELYADNEDLKDTILPKKHASEFFTSAADLPAVGSFADMKLSRPILKGITAAGYSTPTPIQSRAVPVALRGRDICAAAVTGSGKTAAFLIPVLERLLYRPKNAAMTRVLILVPTRELGVQCHASVAALARFTDITCTLCVGGLDVKRQEAELRKAPDVVVATPGRLIDHLRNARGWGVEHVEILIMDEADRMLDAGFHEELTQIVQSTPRNRQTMLFSATMTDNIDHLVALSLKQPVRLFINSNEAIAARLTQQFVRIRDEKDRIPIVMALCKRSFTERVLIFVKSKVLAHRLRILFGVIGLKAGELHGDLHQAQRLQALSSFKSSDTPYLIATDVASRGLDVPGIKTVINMSLPATYAQYVHRVGRTARAGDAGTAISLVSESDRGMVKMALKNAKSDVSYRSVKRVVVGMFKRLVDAAKDIVERVIEEEGLEKEMGRAEMEAARATNMMVHSDEIMGRPARTWFQNTSDKARSLANAKNAPISSVPKDAQQSGKNAVKPAQPKRQQTRKQRRNFEARKDDVNPLSQKLAARAVKKASRPQKIGSVTPRPTANSKQAGGSKKAKKAFGRGFGSELTDTSRKNAGPRAKPKGGRVSKKR